MTRTNILMNRNGLEFQIEQTFAQGEWLVYIYNAAKMIVYSDRMELLQKEDEETQILLITINRLKVKVG